jgi:hypothetical protein
VIKDDRLKRAIVDFTNNEDVKDIEGVIVVKQDRGYMNEFYLSYIFRRT